MACFAHSEVEDDFPGGFTLLINSCSEGDLCNLPLKPEK